MTRPHFPILPSAEFEGESRIGGHGDCVMENSWVMRPYLANIGAYQATLKTHPNPPPANITVS